MHSMRPFAAMLLAATLGGCGYAWQTPLNPTEAGDGYMAERRTMPAAADAAAGDAVRWNAARCTPQSGSATSPMTAGVAGTAGMPLSPGDLVRVSVPGEEAPRGLYKVDSTGVLSLDAVGDLRAAGRTIADLEADLSRRLVAKGFYRAGHARVAIRLLDRGPVRVSVGGAVFQPGMVVINQRSALDRDTARDMIAGDHAIGRTLSAALSNAAGVRPDADLTRVAVFSAGQRTEVDVTGLLTGEASADVMLTDGDRVEVPSRHCFQIALARPSPITPPGVRAFVSNLTSPASNNAGAAVGREATNLPYGTRLLQALASGNCIGGIQMTNADRWAVLVSVNPMTGTTEVIERRIEALVRRADRDGYNPVILPGDAIACYDSTVTNFRDVMRTLWDVLGGPVRPL